MHIGCPDFLRITPSAEPKVNFQILDFTLLHFTFTLLHFTSQDSQQFVNRLAIFMRMVVVLKNELLEQ